MQKRDKIYIALLLLAVAGGIGTREYWNHKIDAFNPDGHYLDSILKEKGWPKESIIHLPITSDTATPETQRDYDSSVKAQEAEDSATPAKGFGFSRRQFLHHIAMDTIPDTVVQMFGMSFQHDRFLNGRIYQMDPKITREQIEAFRKADSIDRREQFKRENSVPL